MRRLPRSGTPKIGIALAGGGPIGGIYELGALRALDDAIDGLDLNRLDCYVGVSSGAFLASALVNKIDTEEMCRILVTGKDVEHPFEPDIFLKPAFGELLKRISMLPELTGKAFLDLFRNPLDQRLGAAIGRFGAALPTGLFDNEGIELFLRRLFTIHGRTNDFRELDRPLRVVAVDLDTSERVCFGAQGHDTVPISRAVQASSALPGLYPPVKIHGHYFVDGALKRTLHGSVALDEGVQLLIGLNPLVPFDANRARENGVESPRSLISGGLPVVLSQTIRALLHSRMQVGLSKYDQRYENADVMLFEPDPDDSTMFFTNVFSFASRARLCAHAYQRTLRDLYVRADALAPVLAHHGLTLNMKVLGEHRRTLWSSLRTRLPRRTSATARLRRVLDDLNHEVQRLSDATALAEPPKR